VISPSEMTRKNAEIVEKNSKENNSFSVFQTLEEAVVWAKTYI